VHAVASQRPHPARHLLPLLVAAVEVVVARRREDRGAAGEVAQRRGHGDGLDVERDRRADVEQVAGDHHGVDGRRLREQPVELTQPVVQVGHQQEPHPGPLPAP